MTIPTGQFLYQPETLGNEFSVLRCVLTYTACKNWTQAEYTFSDFLETLDESSFFGTPQNTLSTLMASYTNGNAASTTIDTATAPTASNGLAESSFPSTTTATSTSIPTLTEPSTSITASPEAQTPSAITSQAADTPTSAILEASPAESVLPSATKTEKFLLTAADQESGTRDERLNRVIRSKYEAGLLKPYNYVKGYARLSRWMDRKYVFHLSLQISYWRNR
jgi:hypothetical protein